MSVPDGHEPPPSPLQSSMLEQILDVKYIGLEASTLLPVASRLPVASIRGAEGDGGGGLGDGGLGDGGGGEGDGGGGEGEGGGGLGDGGGGEGDGGGGEGDGGGGEQLPEP